MNCGSRNISWEIVSIVCESFAHESIYEHCIQCKKDEVNPFPNHFIEWCGSNTKCANCILIYDTTLNLFRNLPK